MTPQDPNPAQIQEPKPTHRKRSAKRRRIISFSILAVLLVVLAIQARPLYRAIKGWRARALAGEVDELIAKDQFEAAAEKARAAYQLKPDEPAAVRALARLSSLSGNSAGAIGYWRRLISDDLATSEDRLHYAEDLLRVGAYVEALRETRSLLEERRDNPAALRLMAKLAAAQGNYEETMEFARRAMALAPEDPENQLLVAILQVDSPRAETRQEGWDALGKSAKSKEKEGLKALLYLAQRRDLPTDMVEAVVSGLREHPRADVTHRLLAYDVLMRHNPDQREALLDKAMQEFRNSEGADLQNFGTWLNARREFNRALETLPLSKAKSHRELFLIHLDSMAGLERWTELEQLLNQRNLPVDEAYLQVFKARIALQLGKPDQAKYHWQQAYVAASRRPEQLAFLGNYAEKLNTFDVAERAYRALFSNPGASRPAYHGVMRILQRRGETVALRNLLGEMLSRWPADASVQNDYAYLNLLLNERIDESLKTARELVQESPRSLPHRTTLALGLLRAGKPAEALEVYEGLTINWDEALPGNRAVHAAVLAANDKMAEARAEEFLIRKDALLKEEQALLEKWVEGTKSPI
jgi:predicted Zn-dependent protease